MLCIINTIQASAIKYSLHSCFEVFSDLYLPGNMVAMGMSLPESGDFQSAWGWVNNPPCGFGAFDE